MYSRVVKVTKEIVKKGISVGICLAMLLPILPLNFSFIMNTEKEASAESAYCTSQANANSWAHSSLRAWLNNACAKNKSAVPDSGTDSISKDNKNFVLDSTVDPTGKTEDPYVSDNTSGYAKSAFPDEEWSRLAPITRFVSDGKGSHHKVTDKVTIPASVSDKISGTKNLALKLGPEGINEGGYFVPLNSSSSLDKYITCTPSSDSTKIAGINGNQMAQDIAVNETGKVYPIISLEKISQIVCAPTIAELKSGAGIIARTLTADTASSSARMCFYDNSFSGSEIFSDVKIDESGRVGFGAGLSYGTCFAMAMKKLSDGSIDTITSYSDSYNSDTRCFWIDFGISKDELKNYVYYAWMETSSGQYAVAGYMTGVYWNGDSLKAVPCAGNALEFDGFKGIVFGNALVSYQGTVPFGNRNWRYLGNDYFAQAQPENVVFNGSTDGYSMLTTGITLSDKLSNGIKLPYTGSAVDIPTDGIMLTGFPANAPISFQYNNSGVWKDGTPQNAGDYYVMASAASDDLEPKYSRAFSLTVKKLPVPVYTAPTTQIEAVWRDKAKDKLPSDLADYFGYPKTASGANIPGTWALVDENAEVGNVDGSNRPIGKFTPDTSVLDTYNWAGLSGWNATEGRLEVPALFTVAPMPADRLSCAQLSSWSLKYDGRPKSWRIKIWITNGNRSDYLGDENYDVVWPEDMTNAGTKTYTVNLKNNCTGTLTGAVAISKREIKITADNQTICYGDQLPQLTWKQSGEGFVGSGSLIEGTVAVEESGNYPGPGNYNIIPSGFSTNEPTNYEVSHVNGTLTVGTDTFEITPRDISNATVTVTPTSKQYTGGVHTPDVVLTDILNGVTKTLTLNTDYTLKWLSNMTNAGEQQGTATGQGNYQRTTDIAYEITPRQITITPESKSQVYGAAEVPIGYTVKDTNTGETLNIKSELTGSLATAQTGENGMRWPNADKYTIGLGTLTSENNPNYLISLGDPIAKYTITKKDVTSDSNVTVRVLSPTLPYTGQAPELELEVKDGNEILVRGTDYTVEADGIEPGTYTFTITFIKNRTGTKEGTYTIQPKSTDELGIVLDKTKFTYNGWFRRPEVTVFDGNDIVPSSEYTLEFLNDVNVGTATAKATMSAKYGNKVLTKTYTIEKREPIVATYGDFVGNVLTTDQLKTVMGPITYAHNNGYGSVGGEVLGAWNWKIGDTVKGDGKNLSVGDATTGDETRTFYAAYGAGDATPNAYMGSVKDLGPIIQVFNSTNHIMVPIEFKVQPKTLTADMLTMTKTGAYTGSEITPKITVKDGATTLKLGKDTISYDGDRVNVGSFKVKVTGQGNYQDSIEGTFTINKRNVNVTIDDKCKLQGTDDPVNTYTVTTEDTGEVLDGIELNTTRTTGEDLGNYVISLASTEHSNVNIVNVTNGTLTIGKNSFVILRRPTTVTAKNTSKTFGEADPKLEYSATNLVSGETLTGTLAIAQTGQNSKNYPNADVYDITQGTVDNDHNPNYNITYVKGTFTITAAPITDSDVTLSSSSFTYDGSEKKPTVTVTVGGKRLTADTDYTIVWPTNPVAVSNSYAIKVTGKGNYSGEVTKTYAITAPTSGNVAVTLNKESFTYNGSKQTPTVTKVTFNGAEVPSSEYEVTIPSISTNADTYTVTVTLSANYGSKTGTATYTINRKPVTVTADSPSIYYGDSLPTLTVQKPGLVAGDSLSGSLKIKQTGKNGKTYPNADEYEIIEDEPFANQNYLITFNKGFLKINPKQVSDTAANGITMSVKPVEGKVFNGQRQTPDEVILKDGAKLLIENVDYDLEYLTNMTDAITHKIKANLKGNYSGSKTADFIITPKQISDNTPESELKVDVDKTGYTDETGYTYDKTPKKPAVTIKAMFGNRTMQLVQGTHFDVNYLAENGTSDVTNVGSKKVVITFKNGFSGTRTIKYAINRRDVTIRANERRRYYKTPDPDMRPRTNYDTINGLIAGDNLYGSFEREDPTNEEVGRYKIIQGRTLTNANNPNYNIIFDAENSGYFIIEVDKSSWGTPQDYPQDHYVDDEGKTSTEVDKYGMVWLRETSDGTSAWYGIDNSKGVFRIGSRFWVMWVSKKESPETYKKYWDMLDEDHKRAMEALKGWIFLIGVTDPDGKEYEKFSEDENGETDEEKVVPTYVQIGSDWDEDELNGVFISPYVDEIIKTSFLNNVKYPEGTGTFGIMILRHFSPYFIYDRDTERKVLEGNDDEANVLRTTVDIKGKTVQIIVSGPRKVLPKGTKLIAVEDRNDNTCKIWLVDQSGKELSSPLSERVEVFIEMVDGMEDLIEVRLPKIGEDFHYGKFDGIWYGAIYTPYFPISLSLDELTDAERDELNKKRGLSGDKESSSDGGSSSSRNGSNAENDGQGDNETEELQPAENGSSNWWQNLSRTQIICITAAGILLLLLLIFLILLILKRRKEKENSSQQ